MVGIGQVAFPNAGYPARSNKPRQIVHMSVGIVSDNPLVEPEGVGGSEVPMECLLVLSFAQAAVALLNVAEQTFLAPPSSTILPARETG